MATEQPDEHMKNLPAYEPPVNENRLLLKWIRRARESQMSHYDMADLYIGPRP